MEIGAEEANRVATLVKYDILDSDAEEPFDRLAEIAAELFDAPIACVSLVDGYRQWFKSKVGLNATEMPREWAFSARIIQRKDVLVVTDATKDREFAATKGPTVRFFAGAPLLTGDGQALGAVCIVDRRVRKPLTGHERRMLQHLADMVMEQIELRRGLRRIRSSIQKTAQIARGGGVGARARATAAEQIVAECDKALEALQTVRQLMTRSTRKRVRLVSPSAPKKPAPGRRHTEDRRRRRS